MNNRFTIATQDNNGAMFAEVPPQYCPLAPQLSQAPPMAIRSPWDGN